MKPMVGVSFRWEPELLERVRSAKGSLSLSAFVRNAVLAQTEALEQVGRLASEHSVFPAARVNGPRKIDDDFDNWGA